MGLPLQTLVIDTLTSIFHTTALSHDSCLYYIMTDPIRVLLFFFAVTSCSCLALLRGVSLRTILILLFVLALVLIDDNQPMFACLTIPFAISPGDEPKEKLLQRLNSNLRTFAYYGVYPVFADDAFPGVLNDREVFGVKEIVGFQAVDEEKDVVLMFRVGSFNHDLEEYPNAAPLTLYNTLEEAMKVRSEMPAYSQLQPIAKRLIAAQVRTSKKLFESPEIQ